MDKKEFLKTNKLHANFNYFPFDEVMELERLSIKCYKI